MSGRGRSDLADLIARHRQRRSPHLQISSTSLRSDSERAVARLRAANRLGDSLGSSSPLKAASRSEPINSSSDFVGGGRVDGGQPERIAARWLAPLFGGHLALQRLEKQAVHVLA